MPNGPYGTAERPVLCCENARFAVPYGPFGIPAGAAHCGWRAFFAHRLPLRGTSAGAGATLATVLTA